MHAEPHPGQPSERDSGDVRPFEASGVENGERVSPKFFERVLTLGGTRSTMTARVVSDDAKALCESIELRIPQFPRGSEGIREEDSRR
jgi:hypothetical protein